MSGPVITSDGLKDFPPAAAATPIVRWAIAAGSGDIIQVAFNPPVLALQDGIVVAFRATAANLTTTPTFEADGLASKIIRKNSGFLAIGDLVLNGEYLVRYNLGLDEWTKL